jgi:hypothetical protein
VRTDLLEEEEQEIREYSKCDGAAVGSMPSFSCSAVAQAPRRDAPHCYTISALSKGISQCFLARDVPHDTVASSSGPISNALPSHFHPPPTPSPDPPTPFPSLLYCLTDCLPPLRGTRLAGAGPKFGVGGGGMQRGEQVPVFQISQPPTVRHYPRTLKCPRSSRNGGTSAMRSDARR